MTEVMFATPVLTDMGIDAARHPPARLAGETLSHPEAVRAITPEGLVLESGQFVRLPGIRRIPAAAAGLAEAVFRGVELQGDRVIGLSRIRHGCGNDTGEEHPARVDVAAMLTWSRQVPPDRKLDEIADATFESGGQMTNDRRFNEWGWHLSDYNSQEQRCELSGVHRIPRDVRCDDDLRMRIDGDLRDEILPVPSPYTRSLTIITGGYGG